MKRQEQVVELVRERVEVMNGPRAVYAISRSLGHGWARGLDELAPFGDLLSPRVVAERPEYFPHARGEEELREALEIYTRLWESGAGKLTPFLEATLDEAGALWKALTDDLAVLWYPPVGYEAGVYVWAHESARRRIRGHLSWLPGGHPWWGVLAVDRPQGPAFILHMRGDEEGAVVGLFKGPAPAGSRHWDWVAELARAIGARQIEEYARRMMEVAREAELAYPAPMGEEEVEG